MGQASSAISPGKCEGLRLCPIPPTADVSRSAANETWSDVRNLVVISGKADVTPTCSKDRL